MSLPGAQLRALNRIERTLTVGDPALGPLFAIFTRLAGHEAMPATERVAVRRWRSRWRWRRVRPAVMAFTGLAVATGALLALNLLLPGSPPCPRTVIAGAARTQPVPAALPSACAARPGTPAGFSQGNVNPR